MARATELSTVTVELDRIENLAAEVDSKLLAEGPRTVEHEMGTATTPVDCYLEVIFKNMLIGEHSHCFVERKSGKVISFTVRMKGMTGRRHIHQLTLPELVGQAKRYKETAVETFKKYPRLAHDYFARAHKLITSWGQKDLAAWTMEADGVDGPEVQQLLRTIGHNISACLLLEKRYEETVMLLDGMMSGEHGGETEKEALFEKAMFRKAKALYELKRFQEAVNCLEKLDYQSNPTLSAMHKTAQEQVRKENADYSSMVKKMFK